MGPQATRNCVIINFNRAILVLVLGLINEIDDINEMRLNQSLSS
jgi:hypothetical protein